jgi:hypothetical protein
MPAPGPVPLSSSPYSLPDPGAARAAGGEGSARGVLLDGSRAGRHNRRMFRVKRNKQAAAPEATQGAPEATQVSTPSGAYQTYELTTFDGKGHPVVMVYSRDAAGRTIKTVKKVRRSEK